MINIYTEPLPYSVAYRLTNKRHYNNYLITIKNLLDYFFYTFAIKVYLKIDTETYSTPRYTLLLKDLTGVYTNDKQLTVQKNTETSAWEDGLTGTINWIDSNRSNYLKATEFGSIGVSLLGEFNQVLLTELKNVVSSTPLSKKHIEFKGVKLLPVIANNLIKYLDYMLGNVSDPHNPQMVIVDDTAQVTAVNENPIIQQDNWVGIMGQVSMINHDISLDSIMIIDEPLYTIDDRMIFRYNNDPLVYMIIMREPRVRYLMTSRDILIRWGYEYAELLITNQYDRGMISIEEKTNLMGYVRATNREIYAEAGEVEEDLVTLDLGDEGDLRDPEEELP